MSIARQIGVRWKAVQLHLPSHASSVEVDSANELVQELADRRCRLETVLDAALAAGVPRLLFSDKSVYLTSDVNPVPWDDICGLVDAKRQLEETVQLPLLIPQLFVPPLRRPDTAILLFGPPGTGKTLIAKSIAAAAGRAFFGVAAADLASKRADDGVKLVRSLFSLARAEAPSVVFIDDVDFIGSAIGGQASHADRLLITELLIELDRLPRDETVVTLTASSRPWLIRGTILRRLSRRVQLTMPDFDARRIHFKLLLADTPHTLQPHEIDELAHRTEGFTPADIAVLVRDALMQPIRALQVATHFFSTTNSAGHIVWTPCTADHPEAVQKSWLDIEPGALSQDLANITMADFLSSLGIMRPSLSQADIAAYVEWNDDPRGRGDSMYA